MNEFVNWLMTEKKLSNRSARDVLSRTKRIKRLLDIDIITNTTQKALEEEEAYHNYSASIKSQLKRAALLNLEFEEKFNGRDK